MKLVMLIAALLLILAGCSGRHEMRTVFSPALADPAPHSFIEPPPLRAGPAPIGIGLPPVHRVMPPRHHCSIKTKSTVQHGRKRTTRYQVCR